MNIFKKIKMILACLIIGCGCSPAQPIGPLKAERVIGAYASWRQSEFPPSTLPWKRLTHLGYAFALPKEDGSVDMTHAAGIDAVVAEARKHGVKVLLAIGGANGSEPFHRIGRDAGLRKKFGVEVMKLVKKHFLDGIDIDWEHWKGGEEDPQSRQALLDLLKELYPVLNKAGKVLAADVFASDWLGKHYDAAIIDHVDWLHIMAYDGSGSWSEKAGPHSSYAMIEGSLGYWIGKVGKEKRHKLVLNVPFYGKKFPRGFKQGTPVPDIEYSELVKLDPANAGRDRYKTGEYEAYYNGRPTIHRKIKLALDQCLAGVAIWELSQDSQVPELSLMSLFELRAAGTKP